MDILGSISSVYPHFLSFLVWSGAPRPPRLLAVLHSELYSAPSSSSFLCWVVTATDVASLSRVQRGRWGWYDRALANVRKSAFEDHTPTHDTYMEGEA